MFVWKVEGAGGLESSDCFLFMNLDKKLEKKQHVLVYD